MRLRKRWRSMLILVVCIGVAWFVTAYLRSPGYRAAQAFALIHEGMSRDAAEKILTAHGGERLVISGMFARDVGCHASYSFGEHDWINLEFQSPINDGTQCIAEFHLTRQSFHDWLESCVESVKSIATAYQSDPNERMQELLNESQCLRETRDEWKRFWMIDQPTHLAKPNE